MGLIEIKTAKVTEKGQIAIPKAIREIEGFEEGERVAILAYNDRIEIRPMSKIPKATFTALASEKSLAKDWNTKEEDSAWKDL